MRRVGRDRQPRIHITEQRVELVALELHVKLALTRRLEALFTGIRVQRIVQVRIDDGLETVPGIFTFAVGIVGQREQVLALDAAFGEERDGLRPRPAILEAGGKRAGRVVCQRIVSGRTLCEANQYPVTNGRLGKARSCCSRRFSNFRFSVASPDCVVGSSSM